MISSQINSGVLFGDLLAGLVDMFGKFWGDVDRFLDRFSEGFQKLTNLQETCKKLYKPIYTYEHRGDI